MLRYLWMLYRFSSSVGNFTREDEQLLGDLPEDYRPLVREAGRRILFFACLGIVISLVILPATVPLLILWLDKIDPMDALLRGLSLLAFAPVTFFLGVFWGLSLGILRAPRWYLGTELGLRWRKLCGANSCEACRAICWLVVVVGLACYGALFWLVRSMAPFR